MAWRHAYTTGEDALEGGTLAVAAAFSYGVEGEVGLLQASGDFEEAIVFDQVAEILAGEELGHAGEHADWCAYVVGYLLGCDEVGLAEALLYGIEDDGACGLTWMVEELVDAGDAMDVV